MGLAENHKNNTGKNEHSSISGVGKQQYISLHSIGRPRNQTLFQREWEGHTDTQVAKRYYSIKFDNEPFNDAPPAQQYVDEHIRCISRSKGTPDCNKGSAKGSGKAAGDSTYKRQKRWQRRQRTHRRRKNSTLWATTSTTIHTTTTEQSMGYIQPIQPHPTTTTLWKKTTHQHGPHHDNNSAHTAHTQIPPRLPQAWPA